MQPFNTNTLRAHHVFRFIFIWRPFLRLAEDFFHGNNFYDGRAEILPNLRLADGIDALAGE